MVQYKYQSIFVLVYIHMVRLNVFHKNTVNDESERIFRVWNNYVRNYLLERSYPVNYEYLSFSSD